MEEPKEPEEPEDTYLDECECACTDSGYFASWFWDYVQEVYVCAECGKTCD